MANINRVLDSPNPPSSEPGTPLFTTPRLLIRRPLVSDAPALASIANDPLVWSFMTDRFPHPYKLSDAESFLHGDASIASSAHPASYPLAVAIFIKNEAGEEGELIGTMGMRPGEDINYRMWDLGYFLGAKYWGRGYASEVVGVFVSWCFGTWPGLVRVQASTYEFNEASGKVLLKSGFRREGLRRDSAEKQGKITGEVFYGVLRRDLEE